MDAHLDDIPDTDLRSVCILLQKLARDLHAEVDQQHSTIGYLEQQLRLAENSATNWQTRFRQAEEEGAESLQRATNNLAALQARFTDLEERSVSASGATFPSSATVFTAVAPTVDLKPKVFDGSIPAKQFVEQFAIYADLMGLSSTRKMAEFQLSIADPKAYEVWTEAVRKWPTTNFDQLVRGWASELSTPAMNRLEASDSLRQLRQKPGEDYKSLAKRALDLSKAAHPTMASETLEEVASDAFYAAIVEDSMVSQLRSLVINRRLLRLEPLSLVDLSAAANELASTSSSTTKLNQQVAKLQQDLATIKADKYVPPQQRDSKNGQAGRP
jgi:hypothetical protein